MHLNGPIRSRHFPCRAETEIKCLGAAIVLFVFSAPLSKDTLRDKGSDHVLKQQKVMLCLCALLGRCKDAETVTEVLL